MSFLNIFSKGGKPSAGPGSRGGQANYVPAPQPPRSPIAPQVVECQRCRHALPIHEAIPNQLKPGSYLHPHCARCDECGQQVLSGWLSLKREGRPSDAKRLKYEHMAPIPPDLQSRTLILDQGCRHVVGNRMNKKCASCKGRLAVPRNETIEANKREWHLECWFCSACEHYIPLGHERDCVPIFLENALLCSRDGHNLRPGDIPEYSRKQIQRISSVKPERGGNCSVHQGRMENGGLVALRTPSRQDTASVDKFKRQSLLWWRVADRHPNLISLLGYWTEQDKLYAVYPWASNGTLSSYVRGRPQDAIRLLHGAADGLAHLHSRTVIHGDISGSNILVGHDGTPMISDPDLVKLKGQNTTTSSKKQASELHRAPEVEAGRPKTEASDSYAFGITIAEVLSGGQLRGKKDRNRFTPQKPQGYRFNDVQERVWGYGAACWDTEPQRRLQMDNLQRRLKQEAYR